MSLETTKTSILNTEKERGENGDLYLDDVTKIIRDILMDASDDGDMQILHIDDAGKVCRELGWIMEQILYIAELNKNAVDKLSDLKKNEFLANEEELKSVLRDMSERSEKLREYRETEEKLREERGHLISIKEECEKLEKLIGQYNEPELDMVEDKKRKLDERLEEIKRLSAENEIVKKELKKKDTEIKEIENGIISCKDDLKRREETLKKLSGESEKLREELDKTNQRIEVKNELETQYRVLFTSINGAVRSEIGSEVVNKVLPSIDYLKENHLEEVSLDNYDKYILWIEHLQADIEKLISVYREQLVAYVNAREARSGGSEE